MKWEFKFGFAIAVLWGIGTAIIEIAQCYPHWSSMCGLGFAFLNFPGVIVGNLLPFPQSLPTVGFILIAVISSLLNGLVLGWLLQWLFSLGHKPQSK